MSQGLEGEVRRIVDDTRSGASEILAAVIDILVRARRTDLTTLIRVVRALCTGQSCMASIWNAAALALSTAAGPDALPRFGHRATRDVAIVARQAQALLRLRRPDQHARPLHITTCSASGTVRATLTGLGASDALVVACAEGRPLYEGRHLAATLGAAGIAVELYTDAAIASVLPRTTAVIVGADAIGQTSFVNKCGTRQLAAAAAGLGVPVYLLAGRDKFLPACLDARLDLRHGAPEEVWRDPPAGVSVQNPYFERIPLDLVSSLVTPMGVLPPEALEEHPDLGDPAAEPERLASLLA